MSLLAEDVPKCPLESIIDCGTGEFLMTKSTGKRRKCEITQVWGFILLLCEVVP
uniref:Uncharacterized protein n=1 Tax=Anguilla anguilla TaxID=7936 RepID=A0A0E9XM86_ANGAN